MSGRGLRIVLCSSNYRLMRATPIFINPYRSFTISTAYRKHGAVPKFPEVSNPELEGLLLTMREKVFLPSHLSGPQRQIIYCDGNRKKLEEEPLKVEVAGEEFILKYINKRKDLPDTTKGLFEIIERMEDKNDWNALPILLEGLKICQRKLKPASYEKLVRKAALASRQDVIVECARRVSRTGFELKDLNLVREIFFWIHYGAIPTEGQPKDVTTVAKALSKAEHIAILLDDKKHLGGNLHGDTDARTRPEVIGVLLELAAVRDNISGVRNEDGKVEMYAQKLLSTLGREVDLRQGLQRKRIWATRSALLCYLSPIINGMREAAKILEPGSETVQRLNERLVSLSEMAAEERELLRQEAPEGSATLGATYYDRLISRNE